MKTVNDFKDYELLDMNNGEKIEKWGEYILSRPDPEIIWTKEKSVIKVHAKYTRSNTGGGHWKKHMDMKDSWQIKYHDYIFNLKLMGFKHTGLFPEQAYNWNILEDIIKKSNKKEIKVLNLFAYTGAASIVALKNGASVVHVDSSRGMIDWAKENVKSNNLNDRPIRFLVDDCLKFVKREIRRGNKYDIIIMDPPSFGRGSSGEVWDIEKDLFELVSDCNNLLTDDALMFLINSYTTGLSQTVLRNILELTVNKEHKGLIETDELGINQKNSNIILPCGIYGRWTREI